MAAKTWAGGGAVAAGQRQPLQQKGFLLEAIIRERGRKEPGSNVVEDEVEAAPSATIGICFARWRWLPFLFAFVVEREGSAAWSGVGCSQKGFAWFLPCCLHFNKQHKIFSTINRPKCNAPGHIANCAQKTTTAATTTNKRTTTTTTTTTSELPSWHAVPHKCSTCHSRISRMPRRQPTVAAPSAHPPVGDCRRLWPMRRMMNFCKGFSQFNCF